AGGGGLYGENDQEQIKNIAGGNSERVKTENGKTESDQEVGKKNESDSELDGNVGREGRYRSRNDEGKNVPGQHWLRSTMIAEGSILVLFMRLFWRPLDM
uniref:IgaA/UmoB family intracellular growth attenuator n=1 Tax=Escherichia coli TaxID=562 RepID=UPI001115829C